MNKYDGIEVILSTSINIVIIIEGGMPNAIVDIWKTGVEYWGYKWTSTFSMPKSVTIEHQNINQSGGRLY